MAIHPIDLQAMYSQMANMANQVAHDHDKTAANASAEQADTIRQNEQQAKSVKKTASEESKTIHVNPDGRQAYSSLENQKNEKNNGNKKEPENQKPDIQEFKDSKLGNFFDITG